MEKRGEGRLIGQTQGGMNAKLHVVINENGRPTTFFMTTGDISDYTGAAALLSSWPTANRLLGDRDVGIQPRISSRDFPIEPAKYNQRL